MKTSYLTGRTGRIFFLMSVAFCALMLLAPVVQSGAVEAKNAMVATQHPLATQAALEILKKGGNAVDAAITAAFALAVVEPFNSGVGGGGFLLAYSSCAANAPPQCSRRDGMKDYWFVDFRERAPLRVQPASFLTNGVLDSRKSVQGWLAPAVPGMVAGMAMAHASAGSLPFAELLEPARRYASKGFAVDQELRKRLLERAEVFTQDPEAAKIFYPKGRPPAVGERLIQRDLAETLESIARKNAAGFYSGWVAANFAEAFEKAGGWIDTEDLRQYQAFWLSPLRGSYRSFEIISAPPPSSGGGVLLESLNLLERFDFKKSGFGSFLSMQRMTEAMRLAFYDRAHFYGDTRFVDVPLDFLLSKEYAARRARLIQSGRRINIEKLPVSQFPPKKKAHTTHLVVVDKDGNAVSMTQSLNTSFGAAIIVPHTGIILNNTMDDFAFQAGQANTYGLVGSEANVLAPGKTPLSSMAPTMVASEGRPILVLGSPGGPRIISSVLNTLLNYIDFNMNIHDAIEAPRLHHQYLPDRLYVEKNGFSMATLAMLRKRGYALELEDSWSNVQAIAIQSDQTGERVNLQGMSDQRGQGLAAGY